MGQVLQTRMKPWTMIVIREVEGGGKESRGCRHVTNFRQTVTFDRPDDARFMCVFEYSKGCVAPGS